MKLRVFHENPNLIICHPDDALSCVKAKIPGADIQMEKAMTKGLAFAVNKNEWEKDLSPASLLSRLK